MFFTCPTYPLLAITLPLHSAVILLSFHLFVKSFLYRTDKNKKRYTGAIIGLGSDPSGGEALLPDHDIELTFDFAFVQDDLVKVCA